MGFGNSGVDVDHLGGVAVEGAAAGAMTAAVDAAVVAEAWSMRVAVEQSLRPKESEVYGVHVPLAERAARLQCLAALSLLAGGEDDACDGGGSGSGGDAHLIGVSKDPLTDPLSRDALTNSLRDLLRSQLAGPLRCPPRLVVINRRDELWKTLYLNDLNIRWGIFMLRCGYMLR